MFILNFLHILFTSTMWVTLFLMHFIVAIIFSWFFRDSEYANIKMAVFFIRIGMFFTGLKIKVDGLENIEDLKTNFIVMANHQSLMDILVLMQAIPKKFSFIAKKELFKIPVLGWDIAMQGHFYIDRKNPRVAVKQLKKIKEKAKKGASLLIFPEGTRSLDGEIGSFKRGAFLLAQEAELPIVPLYINGTDKIVKKHSLKMYPGEVIISIGKPIFMDDFKAAESKRNIDIETLLKVTRDTMLELQNNVKKDIVPKKNV
ncbi:lysophospholipid acyltransferase family protein [Candidatus Margulisiibacteriota bacterium]